jgi:hypothetical protein
MTERWTDESLDKLASVVANLATTVQSTSNKLDSLKANLAMMLLLSL